MFQVRVAAKITCGGFEAIEAGCAGHGHFLETTLFDQSQVFHRQLRGRFGIDAVRGATRATELTDFLARTLDQLGIEVEALSEERLVIRPTDHMIEG